MNTHFINHVLVDFAFEPKDKENALQRTKDFFYEKVLPQLDKDFEEYKEDIYIDKLEVDVGETSIDNFTSKFLAAFRRSWNNTSIQNRAGPGKKAEHSVEDPFLHFLQKGFWPWNFQIRSEKELADLLRSFIKNDEHLVNLIRRMKNANISASQRLINTIFSNTSTTNLFIKGIKKYHPSFEQIESHFDKNWESKVLKEQNFYRLLITELLAGPVLYGPGDIKKLFEAILKKYSIVFPFLPQAKQKNFRKAEAAINNAGTFKELGDTIPLFKHLDAGNRLLEELKTDSAVTSFEEEEKITILNAGLILFHPYLVYVFKELLWINDNNKFINSKVQQKAIMFLQYLLNRKSRQAEHLLVLNKVLCNWPINMPLMVKCNFSKKEKQVAAELLESLKEHWNSLKNTSTQGLIKSFIDRKGIISKTSNGFLLQVDTVTIDILMENLPFGIQTIKLPWNEYFIYTEWTN